MREVEAAIVVRIARGLYTHAGLSGGSTQGAAEPVVSVRIPCGGPAISTVLSGNNFNTTLTPFAEYRVVFSLASVAPACYASAGITLAVPGLPPVTRNRTFIRAAPPLDGSAATVWQVDHEARALRVDGRQVKQIQHGLFFVWGLIDCCRQLPSLYGTS